MSIRSFAQNSGPDMAIRRLHITPALTIAIVPDEYGQCPGCGAYWGHPIKELDFPNRQKVDNHWRCYNPRCTVGYYDPETNAIVERKPHEDDAAGLAAQAERLQRISIQTQEMLNNSIWIQRINQDPNCGEYRAIPKGSIIPAGWELMTNATDKD